MTRLFALALILVAVVAAPAYSVTLSLLADKEVIFNAGSLEPHCRRKLTFASTPPAWLDAHADELRVAPTKADVGKYKFPVTCQNAQNTSIGHIRQKTVNGQVVTYVVREDVPAWPTLHWDLEVTVSE